MINVNVYEFPAMPFLFFPEEFPEKDILRVADAPAAGNSTQGTHDFFTNRIGIPPEF